MRPLLLREAGGPDCCVPGQLELGREAAKILEILIVQKREAVAEAGADAEDRKGRGQTWGG